MQFFSAFSLPTPAYWAIGIETDPEYAETYSVTENPPSFNIGIMKTGDRPRYEDTQYSCQKVDLYTIIDRHTQNGTDITVPCREAFYFDASNGQSPAVIIKDSAHAIFTGLTDAQKAFYGDEYTLYQSLVENNFNLGDILTGGTSVTSAATPPITPEVPNA